MQSIIHRMPAAQLEMHVVTEPAGLQELRPFWTKFNTHPDADIDSYSLLLAQRPKAVTPFVLAATEKGELKAIMIGRSEDTLIHVKAGYLPLLRSRARQITFLQDGFLGDRSPGMAKALVLEILKRLKAGAADRALLERVGVDTDLYRLARTLPGALSRDLSNEITECWSTTLPSSLTEFLKRRSKKHRYWLRRIDRVFEEDFHGRVNFKIYKSKSDVASFCACAEQVASETYQRGLNVGFVDDIEHRRRLELAGDKGWLRAYVALIGQEPVAFWCGRLCGGVMALDWTGFNPRYRKYEVGTVLFLKMVEDLCSAGASAIDYGSGTSFYKERFGDDKHEKGLVYIYAPTAKGFGLNLLKAMELVANRSAKSLARKLGVIDRVKKLWRGRLLKTTSDIEVGAKSGVGVEVE